LLRSEGIDEGEDEGAYDGNNVRDGDHERTGADASKGDSIERVIDNDGDDDITKC
jgi:hypothetical protein